MLITESHTVNVYDSMFDELDQEASTLIQQIFHSNSNNSGIKINMASLQKQNGSTDCGIFTIAVLTMYMGCHVYGISCIWDQS